MLRECEILLRHANSPLVVHVLRKHNLRKAKHAAAYKCSIVAGVLANARVL